MSTPPGAAHPEPALRGLRSALYPERGTGDLSWQDGARCAEADPDLWHPEKGCTSRHAKRICQGCEVRAQCLEWALAIGDGHGILGGTTARQRRRMRHQAALPQGSPQQSEAA